MKQSKLLTIPQPADRMLPAPTHLRHLFVALVVLLTMTAQTAWADSWPEYITDVILVGGTESEVNEAKSAHSDYTFISQDLNAGCGSGSDYIYLGYKKGSRANVNGGYITDIIVVTEGSNDKPTGNITFSGRTYNKAAIYGGDYFVNTVKGDLNSRAGGWGLWLYYTKANIGKQAVSSISFSSTQSGSVNCYKYWNEELAQEGINMNRGCGKGDNIYMHLTTATKTNRPSSDPVMTSGLTYDGMAQQLITTAATLASGTMYYRIGTSGSWTTDITQLTATDAGSYTLQYYAGSNSYSDASSTHSTTVSIGKSPNNGLTVSCPKVAVGGTLSPSLVGTNLSTGSTTYKYATSQDGDYTTTKPTASGVYWVKATIAGDTNCDEYTTPAVKTSIAAGNVTVTSSTTEWLDGGTYNVTSDVTISSRIIINGDVTLNLGEGKTLNANKGIELSNGNKLTITGSGTLTATVPATQTTFNGVGYLGAAIGACNFGELVINSGTVNAGNGSPDWAAGIGGSYNVTENKGNSREGSVTINGGIVNANGGKNAAALGGSKEGSCMNITINGGQVTLRKCSWNDYSYALGYGYKGSSGDKITVGWANADDFIDHDGCNKGVYFVSGKQFILEGGTTPATGSGFCNAGKYVPCFTVTYNTNGGSAVSDTYIGSGSTLTEPVTTRENYTLTGWKNGSADFDFSTPVTSDMTLTAQWTPHAYTITYNGVEGATNPNPANYTIESETITLDAPTKDGYTFAGWFENAGFTGSAVTTIAQGSTGDKTFWAKWIQDLTYGGVTIKDNGTTKSATLDASQEDAVSITSDVVVNAVELNRDFTANQPATVMLPFSLGDGQTVSGGLFYKFSGVTKDGDVWKAQFTEVATLKANTPYLFNPSATGQVTFNLNGGTVTLNTTTTGDAGNTTTNWEFHGTYQKVMWNGNTGGNTDPSDLDKTYGFAKGNGTTIAAGQFVHFAAGAWLKPMRCYLVYNGSTEGGTFQNAPSRTRGAASTEELPQTITVVLLSSSGETTGIGTLDTKTGDITLDGWYTMDGRKLEGKPTKKGLYINNGRKIVIK